eukprot:TRINITY_DN37601_c0_g3_i1.p1 TRINITY_DN37601_c0_g3~~TRINITY_DN37601_c0_g3_i1.p1  ORF type:complete len:907 (+),score=183.50 TRINITY_DN37601_c0_g3_i1:44-2764(+)
MVPAGLRAALRQLVRWSQPSRSLRIRCGAGPADDAKALLQHGRLLGSQRCFADVPEQSKSTRGIDDCYPDNFKLIEETQDARSLEDRDVSQLLIAELSYQDLRRSSLSDPSGRFLDGEDDDGAQDELDVDPYDLVYKLRNEPFGRLVDKQLAIGMLKAYKNRLTELQSPVIDVRIPCAGFSSVSLGDGYVREGKLVVVGDTHGQLHDVLHIFEKEGTPCPSRRYLFNGDICDRGDSAVEIWLLLVAFELRYPGCVHILRGNHENEHMYSRPLRLGGGFTEECLDKYGLSVLRCFQKLFLKLPVFAVIEDEIFVVHAGLFRNREIDLDYLRNLPIKDWQEPYPFAAEDWEHRSPGGEALFDAQWADPHPGLGCARSPRGERVIKFGRDITSEFLSKNNLSLCIRSHAVPLNNRGYLFQHEDKLLTVFSASSYVGRLNNSGAVAVLRKADDFSLLKPNRSLRSLNMELREYNNSVDGWRQKMARTGSEREMAALSVAARLRAMRQKLRQQWHGDIFRRALGLMAYEREELLARCRDADHQKSGVIPAAKIREDLVGLCGSLAWEEVLERAFAKDSAETWPDVRYEEVLLTPQVRWFFHFATLTRLQRIAEVSSILELSYGELATLFDTLNTGDVSPKEAASAMGKLMPSLREGERKELAEALFGKSSVTLATVLHQIAAFHDPLEKADGFESWMRKELDSLGGLIGAAYGAPPLHEALVRFFQAMDAEDSVGILSYDQLVDGFLKLKADAGVDAAQPSREQLVRMASVMDTNGGRTVSCMELLRAFASRYGTSQQLPGLPVTPQVVGDLAAFLFVHKEAILSGCRYLDTDGRRTLSSKAFELVVLTLFRITGRDLRDTEGFQKMKDTLPDEVWYDVSLSNFEVTVGSPSESSGVRRVDRGVLVDGYTI